jgi:MoxR-like ATPase
VAVPGSVDDLARALGTQQYVADRALVLSIHLALTLKRPLFLEGEAGVGKTEVAKALAAALGTDLVRLQCYEGLDITHALYEWNYPRQLLEIRLLEAGHELDRADAAERLFTEQFLIKRPLLRALSHPPGRVPVLLIDEIDRADEEFEGFLLELLSDFQVTIPELGTISAPEPPIVILTSNRTREVHDALKRRCLYFWIDYPDFEKEYRIIMTRMPDAPKRLSEQVAAFVQELRRADLHKMAGVSETLDWIAALVALEQRELDDAVVEDTLGVLLKDHDDVEAMKGSRVHALVEAAKRGA